MSPRASSDSPVVVAPGKVFLAGEWSVLAGGSSVVTSVPVLARASLVPHPHTGHQDRFVRNILASLRREAPVPVPRGRRVHLDLSEFYTGEAKLGVGSSAAGVVAVAGLARVLSSGRIGRRDALARRCARLHRDLQAGHGSGADAAACARGGAILFRMPSRLRPFALPDWLCAVAVAPGAGTRTLPVLRAHARGIEERDPETMANTEAFESAAVRIIDALDRGSWELLVDGTRLAARAYGRLARLLGVDLVTDADREAMRQARRLGGISRPTGAGGGDLHLALFPDPEPAARSSRSAVRRGWPVIPVAPDPGGARLL